MSEEQGSPKPTVPLEDKVVAWISKQGYPLELKVADHVRAAGGWWDHGRTYIDPVTQKSREIDVVGVFAGASGGAKASVQLLIECKHTLDKPWVVFTRNQHILSPYGYLGGLPFTDPVGQLLDRIKDKQSVTHGTTFESPVREGFRLVKALTPTEDSAYQAIGTLTSGGQSLAKRMSHVIDSFILFVPVLVVDGALFESYLPEGTDELVTERVKRATIVHPIGNGDRMPVQVVTVEELPRYLRAIAHDAQWWRRLMSR